MNSPYNETLKLTPTGAKDRAGKPLYLDDRVRRFVGPDSFVGVIVFHLCAFRIKILEGFSGEKVNGDECLGHNYSLLWDEVLGTSNVEEIK